jgi:hypothetical protein
VANNGSVKFVLLVLVDAAFCDFVAEKLSVNAMVKMSPTRAARLSVAKRPTCALE